MPITEWIQRIINILDAGTGSRFLRLFLVATVFISGCLWFDLRVYQNFAAPEAMDSAQLARNISEGRGYVTDFIRPLSLYLITSWNATNAAPGADLARVQTAHPDLANPPVYPLFLAGWMKVLPFRYDVVLKNAFWSDNGNFLRYEPDFLITLINQLLLLAVIGLTFSIARKLFDAEVAWVSAILIFGTEIFWKFSMSGLSTMLLLVIFLGLTRLLIKLEETGRNPEAGRFKLFALAVAAGLLTGTGALTLYSFGWLIVPVALFLALYGGRDRRPQTLLACGAFLLVLGPWLLRNYLVSGTLFGTAGFAIAEQSPFYPGFQLERSLHPDLKGAFLISPYFHKFGIFMKDILQTTLPHLGESWVTMLFFAGLLMSFRSGPVRRLRYFLLMCLGMLALVQALGRTQLSEESPVINTENLLMLVLPLVLIYGTVFFFTILDQTEMPMQVPLQQLRYGAMGLFVVVMGFPVISSLFAGKVDPGAYPPYYPPDIQQSAKWMKPNELVMSDVPWAVAWYGHQQCVWLSLNAQDDFFALNDYVKPVRGLYLTTKTLDLKILSDCLATSPESWGNFILTKFSTEKMDSKIINIAQGRSPNLYENDLLGQILKDDSAFPLKLSPGRDFIKRDLFLTDRKRWLQPLQ